MFSALLRTQRWEFRRVAQFSLIALLVIGGVRVATAQNYGTDARNLAMGGVGDRSNLAWDLVPQARPYRVIPVPMGLFQLFGDLDSLNPTSSDFNPSLLMSYAANPLHYGLKRGGNSAEQSFITDIVGAGLSTDLNDYRGFVPKSPVSASGLVSPSYGKTFWFADNGYTFHGIYLGAGPYLSLDTTVGFDDNLIDLLAGTTNSYFPNTTLTVQNATETQVALAFTGGYRMKLPLPGGGADSRDGIYLAANYNHLYGLRYEDIDLAVLLDTDAAGLLAPDSPVVVDRLYSSNGKGRGIDMAMAVVVDRWDFTASVMGLGNHIDWRDLGRKSHTLASVTSGGSWVETSLPAPSGTLRMEFPVRYSGGFTFDAGPWAAGLDVVHGIDDLEFRGGMEFAVGPIDVRGGGRMVRDAWNPSFGLGFNVTRGFGVDVAMMQMINNLEGTKEAAIALSLRLTAEE